MQTITWLPEFSRAHLKDFKQFPSRKVGIETAAAGSVTFFSEMRFPCPTNRVASALGAQVKINIFPLQKKKSVRGRIDVESSAAWSRSAPAAYLLPPGRWWQIFSRQKRRLEVLQQSTQRGIIAVLSGNPAMFDGITGTSENFTWNDFFLYRSLCWPGDGCSSNLRNVVGWSRLEQCDTTGSWSLCWPGDVFSLWTSVMSTPFCLISSLRTVVVSTQMDQSIYSIRRLPVNPAYLAPSSGGSFKMAALFFHCTCRWFNVRAGPRQIKTCYRTALKKDLCSSNRQTVSFKIDENELS